MGGTLTVRNLGEGVKQKLRLRAARNQRSMEAEARAILAAALAEPLDGPPRTPEEMRERLKAVSGLWKGRGTADELMRLTRGKD